jgi:hypothetical protein
MQVSEARIDSERALPPTKGETGQPLVIAALQYVREIMPDGFVKFTF